MKKYIKPITLVNEEVMEGVYAASGSLGTGSSVSGSASVVVDYDGGEGAGSGRVICTVPSGLLPEDGTGVTIQVAVTFNNELNKSSCAN